MLPKDKNYIPKKLQWFFDIRNATLSAFTVLAVLATWSGIKIAQTNYKLQQQIIKAQQQIAVQQLENETIKLRGEYLKTNQYIELQARQKFGKGAAGETLYIVPKNVALAKAPKVESITAKQTTKVATTAKTGGMQNLQAWFDFLLHRDVN